MNKVAAVALLSANTLVLGLLAALAVLLNLSVYGGEPSILGIGTLLAASIPYAALLVGFRRASPRWVTSLALAANLVGGFLLVAAGAVAGSGLAGLAGLLIFIAPGLAVVCVNSGALVWKLRTRGLTGHSIGPPSASAEFQR